MGTMPAPARMRLIGCAVSAAHAVLALLGELVAGVPGAGLLFGLCAAVSLAVALLAAPLLEPRRPPGDEGDGPRPGGGGEPPEPPWWPDFERDFRAHVARRRTRA